MKPRKPAPKKYLSPGKVILLKQIFLGIFVFSCIGSVIALVGYVTRLDSLTIETVNVSGGITIDKEFVRSKVEEELAGKYLSLVPKRFVYFYPTEEILASVSRVDRLKEAEIERISRTELQVTFEEYIPDTLWCDSNEVTDCLFFDETGYAFAKAPNLSGGSLVRYFTYEKEIELATRPFLAEDYKTTREFTKQLANINWFVSKIEINSVGDVFYTLTGGGEIKSNLALSTAETFENLQSILNSEEFSHLAPGNFNYLDLRFDNRVFVNEVLEIKSATSTESTAGDETIETVE